MDKIGMNGALIQRRVWRNPRNPLQGQAASVRGKVIGLIEKVIGVIVMNVSVCSYVFLTNCKWYSQVRLVWPNMEELISRPFMGLSKIRLLFQDSMNPKYLTFFVPALILCL